MLTLVINHKSVIRNNQYTSDVLNTPKLEQVRLERGFNYSCNAALDSWIGFSTETGFCLPIQINFIC